MIDNNLTKRIQSMIDRYEDVHPQIAQELLNNYKSLIEQNAELHKELAKLKGDLVFVVNDSHDDMEVNNIVSWSFNTK